MTTYMRLLSSRGSPGFWDNVPRGGPKVHDFSQHLQVYAPSGDRVTFPIGLGITKTLRFGRVPLKLRLEPQYSIIRPDDIGTAWNIRLQVAPVIRSPFSR
jgi:hypothetical protein